MSQKTTEQIIRRPIFYKKYIRFKTYFYWLVFHEEFIFIPIFQIREFWVKVQKYILTSK